jgi:hypothetical protein
MDWNMLGAVAELVAALGVVVTLLYLSRQIRSASLESQRSRYSELTGQIATAGNVWAASDVLSDIMFRGLTNPSSLEPAEAFRFYSTVFGFMKAWEASFHYSLERGVHDWGAVGLRGAMGSYMALPGMQQYFEERRTWYSPEFQAEVSRLIAAGTSRLDESYHRHVDRAPRGTA